MVVVVNKGMSQAENKEGTRKGRKERGGAKVAHYHFRLSPGFSERAMYHSDSKNDALSMYAMLCYAMQMDVMPTKTLTHIYTQASDLIKVSLLCYSNNVFP